MSTRQSRVSALRKTRPGSIRQPGIGFRLASPQGRCEGNVVKPAATSTHLQAPPPMSIPTGATIPFHLPPQPRNRPSMAIAADL